MSSRYALIAERFVCSQCLAIFRSGYPRCPLCGAPVQPLEGDPLVGRVLHNRYRIAECVGEGGMGRVYRAVHEYTGKQHAVKVLFGDHAADPKMRARMEQEALAVGKLSHRNVIAVTDAARTDDNSFYLVMDFVKGENLATLVGREAPFASERVATLVKQLCMGLGHAHDNRLVHRDFKSENVLITRDADGELAKIVDFGIAVVVEAAHAGDKLTSEGMVLGTPAFMSPEQSTGAKVDHRSDLFSLGVMMYEMMSGKLPFDGTPLDIARQNLVSTPPPISKRVPDLKTAPDPELEKIAFRLMEKRPEARFQSAHVVLAVLDRLDAGLGVPRPRTVPQAVMTEVTIRDPAPPASITSETSVTPSVQISQLPYEETIATPVASRAYAQHTMARTASVADAVNVPTYSEQRSQSQGRFWFMVLLAGSVLVAVGYLGATKLFENSNPQSQAAGFKDGVPIEEITYENEFDQSGEGATGSVGTAAGPKGTGKVPPAGSSVGNNGGTGEAASKATAVKQDTGSAGSHAAVDAGPREVAKKADADRKKPSRAAARKALRKERIRKRHEKLAEAKAKAALQKKTATPPATTKPESPKDNFERYSRLYQQVGNALDDVENPPSHVVRSYLNIKYQSGIMNATLRERYIQRLRTLKARIRRLKKKR